MRPALAGTLPRLGLFGEEWARCHAGGGLPTRSTGLAEGPSWPAPRGSGGIPRSGSLVPHEGPEKPCPLESPVVQVVDASRSISVAPALDASAAGSRVGRRSASGEQSTAVGSIQREPLDPAVAGPGGPPVDAKRRPRGEASRLLWPGPVAHPEIERPTEGRGRRQRRRRRGPHSIFVAGSRSRKHQVNGSETFSAPSRYQR